MIEQIKEVFSCFDVPAGEIVSVEPCYNGHISRTFFVDVVCGENKKRYVMQEMNEYVFPNIDVLMNNVFAVTEFLYKKAEDRGADPSRSTLHFYKGKNGEHYCRAEDGKPWRMYDFIGGADTYNSCPSVDFFMEVGCSFGRFAHDLADFDASKLGEVIADFHNTASRYEKFRTSVARDVVGRKCFVEKEIAFVDQRKELCGKIVGMIKDGKIPLRVTHNDTKLNNILIDDKTQKGICIIDLDTIMPGSVLYDFGDAIRFGASTAAEDETDLNKVKMSLEMFSAFAKGYVGELKGFISEEEIKLLPLGALIITLETGIRFLTDYLDGDKYFHTSYDNHNLDRARNQFALVADMEKKMPEMEKMIGEYAKE